MLEGIAALALIALLFLAGCAEDLFRMRCAWQEFRYIQKIDRAMENALRRAGLNAFADRRCQVRRNQHRRKEPPVWNRDRSAVDRTDEADRVLDEYRNANWRISRDRHRRRASRK